MNVKLHVGMFATYMYIYVQYTIVIRYTLHHLISAAKTIYIGTITGISQYSKPTV